MARALLAIFLLCLGASQVHAACVYPNNDSNQWGWDAATNQSCPPGGSSGSTGNSTGGAIVALRIYWTANPAGEGVDRYQVDYELNDSGNWDTFPAVWNTTELIAYLNDYGINAGNKICVRLRAGNYQEWSAYTDQVCDTIPNKSANANVTFGVSIPNNLNMQLRDY